MAKRNGRRVNTSRGFPSWKHNSSLSSRSASSANNGTSSPSAPTLDCASDDERTWNVHGDSETTPSELANTRGSRRPARSRGGQQSWVVTLLSLLTVHVVLLVAYGVHSRWQWATELTDYLAAVTRWDALNSDVNDDAYRNYQNVSLRMSFTLDVERATAARRRGMRRYDFRYDEQGVDRRRNLSLTEFRDVYDGKWPVIIEDVVPTWRASNWTHEFLCSTYGQERIAMIGVRGGLETSQKMALPLQAFCDHVNETSWSMWTYVQDELFLPMRQFLRQDVATSIYTDENLFELFPAEVRPWDAMLLWGTTYSRSTLHIDPYNWTGTSAVIRGRKRWKLFPPGQDHLLYIKHDVKSEFPLNCYKYNSAVDSFEVDFEQRYPLTTKARYLEFDQHPGDLLIIPTGWFHQAAAICAERATHHPDDDTEADFIPLTTGSVAEFYIEPMLPLVGDIDVMCHCSTQLAIPRGHPPPTQLPAEFSNYVQAFNMEETIAVSGELTNVNNYRVVLEEILKLKGNVERRDIPLNSHLLSPAQQVKLVMSLLSDDVLSRGQEVTRDILRQMKYISSESTVNQPITNGMRDLTRY